MEINKQLLAAGLTALALVSTLAAAEVRNRPNVLFLAIDDLRAELGCYGSEHIISPNIDKLADAGTLFERAYCQQAVCNPSRASALTGLRPETLGIWDLPTHFREKIPDIVTLPQHFKNEGYHTENIGKMFHNWRQDDWKGDAASWSVPAVLHYNSHGNDKAIVEGKVPPNLEEIPKCERRDVPDEAYFDGRVAAGAVKALERLAKDDKPFFLAVGFWKPHSHFNAPKNYWDLYDRKTIPGIAHPDPPTGVPELALHDSREICRSFKSRPGGRPTAADAIALRHGYYANISFMDAQVGKVLDELDRLDLRRNTIIVLWSDHGFHLGEHSLWAKTSNFELDARVPVIIATPDHESGQRTKALAELLDLYPTLIDLCKLPAPKHALEGVSLRPLLENPNATVKAAAHTWHPRPAYPAKGQDPTAMGYSVRSDRYRYTEWRDYQTGVVVARELYDHKVDPAETRNVAEEARHAEAVKRLQVQLPPVRQGAKAANPKFDLTPRFYGLDDPELKTLWAFLERTDLAVNLSWHNGISLDDQTDLSFDEFRKLVKASKRKNIASILLEKNYTDEKLHLQVEEILKEEGFEEVVTVGAHSRGSYLRNYANHARPERAAGSPQ